MGRTGDCKQRSLSSRDVWTFGEPVATNRTTVPRRPRLDSWDRSGVKRSKVIIPQILGTQLTPEVTDSNQRGRGNSDPPKWLICGDPRVTHRKARATCRNGFTSIPTTDSGLVLFRAAKKSRFLAHAQDPCFAARRPPARPAGEMARPRRCGTGGPRTRPLLRCQAASGSPSWRNA